jgi:pimeloyl-ACP methyl ester carboxylesterase
LTYPEEIAGVVTLAGAPYWKDERAPLYARALAFPVVGRLLANTILVPIGFGVVEAGLDAVFAPETRVPEEYLEAYAAYELRPEQLLAHGADMVDSAPYVRELMPRYDELRVPVILVHGTEDGSVDLADSRRLHAEVPNSQLVVVPGAGHELMFTRPQVVMEAIGRAFEATGEGG